MTWLLQVTVYLTQELIRTPFSERVTSLQLLKKERITSSLLRKNSLLRTSAFFAPFVCCEGKRKNSVTGVSNT